MWFSRSVDSITRKFTKMVDELVTVAEENDEVAALARAVADKAEEEASRARELSKRINAVFGL